MNVLDFKALEINVKDIFHKFLFENSICFVGEKEKYSLKQLCYESNKKVI